MKNKLLSEMVFDTLNCDSLKKSTAESFRKLYRHCESGTPLSIYLRRKFTELGIYHPEDNKITDPVDEYGLVLQAMVFDGYLQCKCPNGIIHSLDKYKERKILSRLLVTAKSKSK